MNKTGLKYLIAVSSAFFSMDKIGLAQINYQENKESQTQEQQAKLKRIEAEIQSLKNQINDKNANLPGSDFSLNNTVFAGKLGGKYVSDSGSVTKPQNLLKRVVGQPNGIWLSGKIEDSLSASQDTTTNTLNLVRLDLVAKISDWVYFEQSWNLTKQSLVTGFFTVGNQRKTPFYVTIGRSYLDFGYFDHYNEVLNPMLRAIFRMTSSVIDVGYLKNNLNISAYTYQSNQKNTPSFGSAIRYQINQGNWTNKMALSIVSDSRNQSSVLQSLNTSNAMPLADAYFSTAYEKFKGSMELIEALANDNSGKRLQAMGIMGAYTENIFAHQSVFSFTYDRMWHGQSAFNVSDYNASGIYKAQYIAAVKVKFDDEFYVGLSDQLAMGFNNKYNNTMMLSGTLLF